MAQVSVSNLIKDTINNQHDSVLGNKLRKTLENGDMVTDDFINNLMLERLNKVDCKSMGFCLEGYPRNQNQRNFMRDVIKIHPDIVFVLDCPDHIVVRRMNQYKYDPITERIYSEQEIG